MITQAMVLVAATVASPAAAQPFSQSMAQCAGLYEALSALISTPDRKAKLDAAAAIFTETAWTEAEAEGQSDPAAWVDGHRRAMRDDWTAKGRGAVFSQDFLDWTGYCNRFATSRGIELNLD
ncbi:MAG: hypothetical protein KDK10_12620 [Maritimibacter sp.]|nr:hypothetical protein [Maritimibacter sp.]